MEGFTSDICPLALVASAVIVAKRGYKSGENVFNVVKFTNELTYFTSIGSRTKFKVV